MPKGKKTIVSFALEPELRARVDRAVAEEKKRDNEVNFSVWMRGAVRMKLKAAEAGVSSFAQPENTASYLKVAEEPGRPRNTKTDPSGR